MRQSAIAPSRPQTDSLSVQVGVASQYLVRILGPTGFIGGIDRLRIAFVQGDAGKRPSLFSGSDSLLCRKNSLFLQNSSLFGRVGNSDENPRKGKTYLVPIRPQRGRNRDNSLYF